MLADVYRSRLGLLATPSVPTVVVEDDPASGTAGPLVDRVDPLTDRVGRVVADTLGPLPVPVMVDGSSVVVILALVEPVDAATVYAALTAEFGRSRVQRRALSLSSLTALGPLHDRLDPPPEASDTDQD